MAVTVMALVEDQNQSLIALMLELLSGIAFAKTLVDVNCAAGAALEDLRALVGGI